MSSSILFVFQQLLSESVPLQWSTYYYQLLFL